LFIKTWWASSFRMVRSLQKWWCFTSSFS